MLQLSLTLLLDFQLKFHLTNKQIEMDAPQTARDFDEFLNANE